ncbi:MAG: LysM peptidoglycan-binding domain-containing protein [Opitutaceae bacterium]|jgi:LysM repeat protein|nr:LysM peptidoglycan-binding domain-containing protein [Opitutaceae bacterium]
MLIKKTKPMIRGMTLLLAALASLTTTTTPPARAQQYQQPPANPAADLAALRQEVALASENIRTLASRVEQLETENARLRQQITNSGQSYASTSYVNESINETSRLLKAAIAQSKSDTLQQVGNQMEKLARETNAAIDSIAKSVNTARTTPPNVNPPTFNPDFPKEGIEYTVQRGDTISSIAAKTGARAKDIMNANRITDPTKIQVGQKLFIPGGN